MNLIEVMKRFPDQEHCIEHLERLRWRGTPVCPHCGSIDVVRKKESGIGRVGRWHCKDCKASFKVTQGTVFQGTKMPLQKWFMVLALIRNAKKGISSCQLERDLDLNQKTAWFILTGIRAEMANQTNPIRLQGIIEADEIYIGGKPRKANKKADREQVSKRGRGTDKTAVIGAVERGGQIVAEVAKGLTGRDILAFIICPTECQHLIHRQVVQSPARGPGEAVSRLLGVLGLIPTQSHRGG